MNNIRINLLPWREALQFEREDRLKKTLAVAVLFGVLIGIAAWYAVGMYYDSQTYRVTTIETEMNKPKYAQAAANLRQREALIKDLTNKLEVLNGLNTQRAEMVTILEQLASSKESGVSIHILDFKPTEISFVGAALSQERLISFTERLETEVGLAPIPYSQEHRVGNAKLTLFGIKIHPEVKRKKTESKE